MVSMSPVQQNLRFYDAVGASSGSIPSGVYANVYVNGASWAVWSESEIERMSHVMRQSTRPETEWMSKARGLDFEPGNPINKDDVVACAKARHQYGHRDFTLYVDVSYANQTGVVDALKAAGVYFRLWVAEWDNTPDSRPVLSGVAAWAKQYANSAMTGHGYDMSVLYGFNDFERVT